jgi:DNA polymerase-1
MAFDTETTGLDPWGKIGVDRDRAPCRPFMVQWCNEEGDVGSLRWQIDAWTRKVYVEEYSFNWLKEVMANKDIEKVFFNAQFDRRMLELSNLTVSGKIHDVMHAMRIVSPNEIQYGLKYLCKKFLNIDDNDQNNLKKSVSEMRRMVNANKSAKTKGKYYLEKYAKYLIGEDVEEDYWLGDEELCRIYGELDAHRTMHLFLTCEQELLSPGNEKLKEIYEAELELMDMLKAMENRGIRVDIDRLKEVKRYYADIIEEYSKILVEEVGPEFNPNSPKQMRLEFFGNREYKPLAYSYDKKKKKSPVCSECKGQGCQICQMTGRSPKCDADFLASIATKIEVDETGNDSLVIKDRLANALLYIGAADTMTSYIKQYEKFMTVENGINILHPNIKQSGTKTGRMSAECPNTQNVASDESSKKRCNIQYRLRELFIPRKGFIYYIPDYSQIEVWLLMLRAGATKVVEMLAAGGDAHQIVSNFVWGHLYNAKLAQECETKDPKTLTPEEKKNLKIYKQSRKKAKNLQFCKIYGGGKAKIASMIGVSVLEAESFIEDYDARLPEVADFMKSKVKQSRRDGITTNAYGRKYDIEYDYAYRSTNYDIQGSAADLIKRSMIYGYRLSLTPRYRGKMFILLTIHDELMIEIHESIDDEQTRRDIARVMGQDYTVFGSPIPFPIGMKIAKERWSESREVKL